MFTKITGGCGAMAGLSVIGFIIGIGLGIAFLGPVFNKLHSVVGDFSVMLAFLFPPIAGIFCAGVFPMVAGVVLVFLGLRTK